MAIQLSNGASGFADCTLRSLVRALVELAQVSLVMVNGRLELELEPEPGWGSSGNQGTGCDSPSTHGPRAMLDHGNRYTDASTDRRAGNSRSIAPREV